MNRQKFGLTHFESSRLGFGCIQLTAQRNRKEAISVLEHCYSLGITHFDVARAYGFGRTEGILGEFLQRKRDKVTVTTKFGIQPPSGVAGNARLINAVKGLLQPFPRLMQQAKNRGASMGKAGVFIPEAAIRSLEKSLRELRTDYVDIFLLHEATVDDANCSPLVETLLSQVAQGKIRHFGVGSAFRKIQGRADQLPAAYEVLQFNDNAVERHLTQIPQRDRRFLITHSVFASAELLRQAVKAYPQIVRQHSLRIGLNLADPSEIEALLLRFALASNANGIVLFSSTSPQHITANVATTDCGPLDEEQKRRFVEFVDELLAAMNSDPTMPGIQASATGSDPS